MYEIQTVECGGIPCIEYRYEPENEVEIIDRLPDFDRGKSHGLVGIEAEETTEDYYSGWCLGHKQFLEDSIKLPPLDLDDINF